MSKIKIAYGSIEAIHAHARFTLDIRSEDEQWRVVGDILFGVDDHEATRGLLDIAEKYRRGLRDCDTVEVIGYGDKRTIKKG